jgi:hypothetical protein
MAVSLRDSVIAPEVQPEVFKRAGEPKELLELDCGHFDVYSDNYFEQNISAQIALFGSISSDGGFGDRRMNESEWHGGVT